MDIALICVVVVLVLFAVWNKVRRGSLSVFHPDPTGLA